MLNKQTNENYERCLSLSFGIKQNKKETGKKRYIQNYFITWASFVCLFSGVPKKVFSLYFNNY